MSLRWWLLVMDALAALGAWGSAPDGWRWRAYLCAVARAGAATDWGQGAAGEPWDDEVAHG